ncbi:MAG: hypothetical protein N2559_09630 [Anaerolineae bacterium]|nr:hypothetical protein [Anaerolineae bacterium]
MKFIAQRAQDLRQLGGTEFGRSARATRVRGKTNLFGFCHLFLSNYFNTLRVFSILVLWQVAIEIRISQMEIRLNEYQTNTLLGRKR